MSSEKAKAIQMAKKVREEFDKNNNQPLVDIFQKIFNEKNIKLEYDIQGELTEYYPKQGAQEASWKITLPRSTSEARNNFTIAHELGHIFLQHKLENNKIARSGLSTLPEIAANAFAAEFLMPKDEFCKAAEDCDNNEQILAEKFNVSQSAALIRMIALGIIS